MKHTRRRRAHLSAALTILACAALAPSAAGARPLPTSSHLLTGAATTAANFPSWQRAFGGRLNIRMMFIAWAFHVDPATALAGPGIPMITWEPWKPPPLGTPISLQGVAQPAYSNQAIASGKLDGYIFLWARAIKKYARPVILRPMHEFTGVWYPWSINSAQYVLAWRHIWNIFHYVGATNVSWVWSYSPGPNAAGFQAKVGPYWPGSKYVDVLGESVLRFAQYDTPVAWHMQFLSLAHHIWGKPTMITEANVAYGLRDTWLTQVRAALATMPYNQAFVWSQLPSRGEANNPSTGNMNWDARATPDAAHLLASFNTLPF